LSDAKGKDGGTNTNYYSPAEWNKLSFDECNKICKERDKKGEQGGTKHLIGDLSVKQFTAIISAVKNDQATTSTADSTNTSTSRNNAGNAFGRKEAAKRTKSS
jgi:hypothetical protein